MLESQSDPETVLAFWLEQATPGDPRIVEILVERYGIDLLRLAQILLARGEGREGIVEKALELTADTLRAAASDLSTFRGAPSVRSWLFAMLYRRERDWLNRLHRPRLARPAREAAWQTAQPVGSAERLDWAARLLSALDELPGRQRRVVILQAGMGLSVPEIEYVLGDKKRRIERALRSGNAAILGAAWQSDPSAPDLDEILPLALTERWPGPEPEQLYAVLTRGSNGQRRPRRWLASDFPEKMGEIGVVLLLLCVALLAAWFFGSQDTHDGKPLFPSTPAPTPTSVPVAEVPVREATSAPVDDMDLLLNLEPALSVDGRWLVYSRMDQSGIAHVYLYDRDKGRHVQIDRSPDDSPAEVLSYSPSISMDGRWVAFVSSAGNLVPGDTLSCDLQGMTIDCFDVYLYNRDQDSLTWITRAPDGSPADGHSFEPVISPDGRWVAFWSSATNLAPGDPQICGEGYKAHACWDVFLYDRESGQIQHLAVGRGIDVVETYRMSALSLSDSGAHLALTVHADDLIAEQLGLTNRSEVWVYRRAQETWQPVAVDPSGRPGQGDSFMPVLSSVGRYLAFVSLAEGLVPGDANGFADVFVRDLLLGMTEIVSVSSQGEVGDGHSGIMPPDSAMWGERLGLSRDGRYVTFISHASNLTSPVAEGCRASQFSYCADVYLHDRRTGITSAAITQTRGDGYFLFPGISGDGSTVQYVQYHPNCEHAPYCADILLYDQRSGMTGSPLAGELDQLQDAPGEWRTSRFIDTLDGGGVSSLAFSVQGDRLASGLSNGRIRLWSIPDGALLVTLMTHTRSVESLAYSEDGALLASAAHDGAVGLWSAADNALLRRLPGESGAVFSLAFYPDGKTLAVGAQHAAWNWQVSGLDFSLLDYVEYSGAQVRAVAVSPDGSLLAHGLSDGSLWLRGASNMQVIVRVSAHSQAITSLEFSSDGAFLASGAQDGWAQLWRIEPGGEPDWRLVRVAAFQHADWVNDLAFSPDGRWLAVAAFRSNIHLWAMPGSQAQDMALNAGGFQPLSIAFSPDGHWLAVGSSWGGVRLWEYSGS